MSFVFVSHTSCDKADKVRPVVEALLYRDFDVWVDQPLTSEDPPGLGFSREFVEEHGIRGLRLGADYRNEIKAALREAGAVLVLFGGAVARHRTDLPVAKKVFAAEIEIASYEEKMIPVVVDDFELRDLPEIGLEQLSRQGTTRLDAVALDRALGALKAGADPGTLGRDERLAWEIFDGQVRDALEHKIEEAAGRPQGAEADRAAPQARGIDLGGLLVEDIGRSQVVDPFVAALFGTERVMPFFLTGPEDECVELFMRRLCERVPLKPVRRPLERTSFDWVMSAQDFRQQYLAKLLANLEGEAPDGELMAGVARAINERQQPQMIDSIVPRVKWDDTVIRNVGVWLGIWHELAQQVRERVFPVVWTCLPSPGAPDWHGREPFCPQCDRSDSMGKTNLEIVDAMDRYKDAHAPPPATGSWLGRLFGEAPPPAGPRLPLKRLHVVPPVLHGDLTSWLGPERADLKPRFDAIFAGERRTWGIPMQTWRNEVERLAQGAGDGR